MPLCNSCTKSQQLPQQQPSVGDVPQGLSETDARVNYSFNGIQNVSRSGICIPLIFGEVFTGSIVVSSGTDTAPVYFGG